jgi:hypothetical protein
MSDTLQLKIDGGEPITLRRPDFGYVTTIKMALHFAKVPPLDSIWDDGYLHDSRKCKISRWLVNTDEQTALITFLNDLARGRNNDIQLILGNDPSGFFPFGADLGDKGTFVMQIPVEDYKEGKQLYDPIHWWENDLVMYLKPGSTLPSYDLPPPETEGDLRIGTIEHLLYPQEPSDSNHIRALLSSVTENGTVDVIDKAPAIDEFETTLPLLMRKGNCANLLDYLVACPDRSIPFDMSIEGGQYLFGILYPPVPPEEEEESGYCVNFIDNKLEITHVNYDQFIMKLKLKLISKYVPEPPL